MIGSYKVHTMKKNGSTVQEPIEFCIEYSVIFDRRPASIINGTSHRREWRSDCE